MAKITTPKGSKTAKPVVRVSKVAKTAASPLLAIGSYFVGSWQELREVRWTNRKTTWSLTLAVLLFSTVLTILIVLLDLLFDFISKRILL